MIVNFENVGNSKANFSRECDGYVLTYEWLCEQLKPYFDWGYFEFFYDEETNKGVILDGSKKVGDFNIESEESIYTCISMRRF